MKKTRNLAFVVELLLLFVILLFVVVVITKTFMQSRSQSLSARHLTEAVCLAEEAAEVTSSAADKAGAAALLQDLEQAENVKETEDGIELDMKFIPEDSGDEEAYHITLQWTEETAETGTFVNETIRVYLKDDSGTDGQAAGQPDGQAAGQTEPVYQLETGSYHSET